MFLAIIQARMGSSRLSGKVLMEIESKPLLAYQLDRLKKSKRIDKIVVATTEHKSDDLIEDFCLNYGVDCFRGSENDVLARYYNCAVKYNANTVIRLTADCPFSDPSIIDDVVEKFNNDNVDFCANTVPIETSMFPDGFDVEVFSFLALKKAFEEEDDKKFREHVTFQFWQTDKYQSSQLTQKDDFSYYRFAVDYPEDFELVEFVIKKIKSKKIFGNINELISIIDNHDNIRQLNSMYYPGQGWNK
jgi:spore coat polysaccharide biosynthesis protein SpsF